MSVATPGGPPSVPIDISGITFQFSLRTNPGDPNVYLTGSTNDAAGVGGNPSLINGGSGGNLMFNIPAATMSLLLKGSYVMDILAIADGYTVNVYQNSGPATVTVDEGIT